MRRGSGPSLSGWIVVGGGQRTMSRWQVLCGGSSGCTMQCGPQLSGGLVRGGFDLPDETPADFYRGRNPA